MVTRPRPGFALMEVIIVSLLMGLVFFACTTVYVATLKTFLSVRGTVGRNDTMLAVEYMTRKIAVGNEIWVDNVSTTGDQLRVRVDLNVDNYVSKETPFDTTDDSMIKFRIQSGKLYWRWDAAGTAGYSANADSSNAEVAPGLTLLSGSQFSLTNPTSTGSPTVVKIRLVSQYGDASQNIPVKTMTYETSIAPVSKPKN